MRDTEWTSNTVVRLIQEYEARPQLWDTNHESYRLQTAKYDTWCELASMFKCDIVVLRKKLNSVFASHRREKARVRKGVQSNWFLYKHLKFLPSHIDDSDCDPVMSDPKQKNIIRISTKPEVVSDEDMEEEMIEDHLEEDLNDEEEHETIPKEIIIKEERITDEIPHVVKKRPHFRPQFKQVRRVNKNKIRQQFVKAYVPTIEERKPTETSNQSISSKDECDSFGEYIASSLRKHDDRTQAMIKQAINNILFEQEMKKYNTNQYIVISGIEENPLTLDGSEK